MIRIRRARSFGLVVALLAGAGLAQVGLGGAASAASGGGMMSRKGDVAGECYYRPGQLIAPPGLSRMLSRYAGVVVKETGSLVPERLQPVLPSTVQRYSLYDVGGADPFDVAVAANSGGIAAAPNYVSGFAPGVRTWAPGEDAVLLSAGGGIVGTPGAGEGTRIGVLDTGYNPRLAKLIPGAGTVTYRSAASMRTELAAKGLIAPSYVQPTELTVGRAAGHGTFIAGLLRRALPAAKLVVAQVPFHDGGDASFDVASAPGFSEDTSSRADDAAITYMMYSAFTTGGVTNVDVLSLSFGSYGCGLDVDAAAGDGDFRVPVGVRSALLGLWELSGRTLRVAAAAGNDRTDEPFYPAAYAAAKCFDPGNVPPSGPPQPCPMSGSAISPWLGGVMSTPSMLGDYSNDGPWAIVRAAGSDVASIRHDLQWYSWSGTSFAAPCAAVAAVGRPGLSWFDVKGTTLDCGLGAKLLP
jgi:hypothetical protein